ncbi:MAG TPA: hypothetical protein VGD09_18730 [Blastococcus sp.]|jgi:hypothetical protein
MSSPRDREPGEGFDPAGEGSGWREPEHLGGGDPAAGGDPEPAPPAEPSSWEPPGWNLPPAVPDRTPPAAGTEQEWTGGPRFGDGPRAPAPMERAFRSETDLVGAQGWALQHGWTISDGEGPEDAVLRDLMATSPVRPGKEARPASVLRGRAGALELVAFDIAYPLGKSLVPKYAVTAAPLLGTVPGLRLSPARFWRHRTGGLVPIVSGNDAFDARWLLLAAEDSPQVRRLVQDPAVQGLLLGTDDGDEFWTGAGFLAAVRPDGHRPQLIEHHTRLLAALVGALAAGS